MITLYNYLHESLSLDMKLNEASLLDDIDDLEKNSDLTVERQNTIGSEYEISYFTDYSLMGKLDKKLLKTHNIYWGETDFKMYRGFTEKKVKPNKSDIQLANIILSQDKELLQYDLNKNNNIPKDHKFVLWVNSLMKKWNEDILKNWPESKIVPITIVISFGRNYKTCFIKFLHELGNGIEIQLVKR